jgi:uncharacterized protein DUF3800
MDVFLDESGYTGPDLMNRDQPVFVLASTVIGHGEASTILRECFGNAQKELKYTKLSRSRHGRNQILAFLAALGFERKHTSFWAAHKEYILLTHLRFSLTGLHCPAESDDSNTYLMEWL